MEIKAKQKSEPQLQAPGAGLPWAQRIILRFWIGPFRSKRYSLTQIRSHYEDRTRRIIERVTAISLEKRSERILVDPIPGIEDSSRYWSLNGVLEHLMIVAKSVERVILDLSQQKVPEGKADPARVKPKRHEQDFLAEFISYAPDLLRRLDEQVRTPGFDLNSTTQFDHPWFGPFTAKQWYWLLGAHQAVHAKQVKAIIAKLK